MQLQAQALEPPLKIVHITIDSKTLFLLHDPHNVYFRVSTPNGNVTFLANYIRNFKIFQQTIHSINPNTI